MRRRVLWLLLGVGVLLVMGAVVASAVQGWAELREVEREEQGLLRRRWELEQRVRLLEETVERVERDPEAREAWVREVLGYLGPGDEVLVLGGREVGPRVVLTGDQDSPIFSYGSRGGAAR